MCGICGELRFDGSTVDMSAIERMSDRIARRGPDHAGIFSDGALALGHRRLSIIDLSADGDQPPFHLGQCMSWDFDGPVVQRHYPQFAGWQPVKKV